MLSLPLCDNFSRTHLVVNERASGVGQDGQARCFLFKLESVLRYAVMCIIVYAKHLHRCCTYACTIATQRAAFRNATVVDAVVARMTGRSTPTAWSRSPRDVPRLFAKLVLQRSKQPLYQHRFLVLPYRLVLSNWLLHVDLSASLHIQQLSLD